MFPRSRTQTLTVFLALILSAPARGDEPVALSILPLGDSITYGLGYNTPGGYRTRLATDLAGNGFSPTFLGSDVRNASATLTSLGQARHEGHPGYRIDDIAGNLDGYQYPSYNDPNNGGYWLAGGHGTGRAAIFPDVITLLVGNNDIAKRYDPNGLGDTESDEDFVQHMADRLRDLIVQLVTDRPSAKVIVSGLIPIADDRIALVRAYNALIHDQVVPDLRAAGKSVFYVDQYHNFIDDAGDPIPELQPDSVHPNQTGYGLMGDTWAAAIGSAIAQPPGVSAGEVLAPAVPDPSAFWMSVASLIGYPILKRRSGAA